MTRLVRSRTWWCATVLAFAWTAAAQQAPFELQVTETSRGVLEAGARADLMVFSATGRRLAYPQRRREGWRVIVDGQPQADYPWILPLTLVFSADGSRLAYVVQRDTEMALIVDGQVHATHAEIARPVFSRDGRRMAYAARPAADSPRWTVYVDGKAEGQYDLVIPRSFVFSPDGSHLGYAVQRGDQRFYVLDGQEGPGFNEVSLLEFSANSQRSGYLGRRGGIQTVMIDGKEFASHERVGALALSPDGNRVAYAAASGKSMFVVVDGKHGRSYDSVGPPIFSPDSTRVAYFASMGRSIMPVVDDQEGIPFDRPTGERSTLLLFSGNSRRVAYVSFDGRKQSVVVDGKAGREYDFIGTVLMSHDGSTVVYAAKDFSRPRPDVLVINERELPGPGFIAISPDGRRVAHVDIRGASAVLMVDEVEGPTYDGFPRGSRLVFEGNDLFVGIGVRRNELLLIEARIVPRP